MYKPTKPVVVNKDTAAGKDPRPISGNVFSARVTPHGVADGEFALKQYGENLVIYFKPFDGPKEKSENGE